MRKTPKTETVDGVTFELRPLVRFPTNPEWVCLRKTPRVVARYKALAAELQGCRMMEVGVDRGGGTSFFLKCFQPQSLLAIDLAGEPAPELSRFLAVHDKDQRVNVHWGVDQADSVEVPRLVSEMFNDQPLDIIVDDASHLLRPTTKTFEMLFPRLRRGGIYVIEDWTSEHLMENRLAVAMASKSEAELAAEMASQLAADPANTFQLPMSFLICQILIAAAYNPDWIESVQATNGICEIRRGHAEIEPGTPISSYIGRIGQWMLDKSP
jgi:predicted O-methyltransferase YrrM